MYLDSSGSMNYLIPTAQTAMTYMRSYLQTLYYNGSSEAQTFVRSPIKISDERWIYWLGNPIGDRQLSVALINESQSIYHSGSNYQSSTFTQDFGRLQTQYLANRNADPTNFQRGIIFALNDYSSFQNHLTQVFKDNAITNHGVNPEYNVSGSWTADQIAEYMLRKMNLPTTPSVTAPSLTAVNSGGDPSKVVWDTYSTLQKITGEYGAGGTFVPTQSKWEVEVYNILSDGTKNFQALIDLGTSLPTTIEYLALGSEPTKDFSARIVARGASGHADKFSNYTTCSLQ